MTKQIRKHAPEDAQYWHIFNGNLWFFKLDDDDNLSVWFSDDPKWQQVDWIDIEYVMRHDVYPLEAGEPIKWALALSLVVILIACGESIVDSILSFLI